MLAAAAAAAAAADVGRLPLRCSPLSLASRIRTHPPPRITTSLDCLRFLLDALLLDNALYPTLYDFIYEFMNFKNIFVTVFCL